MKQNMGKIDRVLRGLVGISVICIGIYYQTWWGAIGIVPLFTTVFAWCPIYLPFGISTCQKD